MPYTKIANHIKKAQREVYQTLPKELRALHALTRIAAGPRKKKAFSQGDITRMIDQLLRSDGHAKSLEQDGLRVPKIDWGKIFMVAINQMARRYGISPSVREDFLNDVVGDMIMGESVMRTREVGTWEHNLMGYIEKWVREGYDDNRIKAVLTNFIKNKLANLYKRWSKQRGHTEEVGFEVGAPGDDYQGKDVYENLFNMDGLSTGQMGTYMRLIRNNPVVNDMVNRITQKLERRDDSIGYVWQAYLKDPTATMSHLLSIPINATIDGRRQEVPLWVAMGYDGPDAGRQAINHHVKKLRKHLMQMWPEIDDILRDIKAV